MRRILYLIDNYSLGGAQVVVRGIMENHPDDSVFSIALRKKEPVTVIRNSQSITLNSTSRFSLFPLVFLGRFIRSHQIEILHCQLPRSIVFGFILKVFFFRKLKYIIHEQGDIFESRAYAGILWIISRSADGIIACSKATGRMLSKRAAIPDRKITVVYNYVDLARFTPAGTHPAKAFTIGFAGRIVNRKGWREFLQVAELLRSRTELKFVLAGAGTESDLMAQTIRDHQLSNVEYLGYVADMTGFYNSLRLLIIPSYAEPMGMVAIEAMACGIPVIASDVEGLNEIVSDHSDGWLVPVHSPEQIARVVEEFMDQSPDFRRKISENAILKARSFSYTAFDTLIRQYHEKLIEQDE